MAVNIVTVKNEKGEVLQTFVDAHIVENSSYHKIVRHGAGRYMGTNTTVVIGYVPHTCIVCSEFDEAQS